MFTALLIFQVVLGITIIALVLLQRGKGAEMGAAFGAGASGTVFGARGGGSFFTRTTAVLATLFFVNSVLLSSPVILGERHPESAVTGSVVNEVSPPAPETEPQAPAADAVDMPPMDLPDPDRLDGGEPAVDSKSGTAADDLPPAEQVATDAAPADKKPAE